jgi:hypothetical protein
MTLIEIYTVAVVGAGDMWRLSKRDRKRQRCGSAIWEEAAI